jgi:hypothetical protein
VILEGRYFYYQLQPGSSAGYGYLDALTISLESVIGDADLVVSVTNPLPRVDSPVDYSSRQTDRFEAVTLRKGENFTLNRTVYIAVYAASMTVYQLTFTPTYSS